MRATLTFFALVLLFLGKAANANNAVDAAHECLSGPFTTNAAFIACLDPVEKAGMRISADAPALSRLTASLNGADRKVLDKITASLGSAKQKKLKSRMNNEGFRFLAICIDAQRNAWKVSDELALARCNFDTELWILHFLFDHYRNEWDAIK